MASASYKNFLAASVKKGSLNELASMLSDVHGFIGRDKNEHTQIDTQAKLPTTTRPSFRIQDTHGIGPPAGLAIVISYPASINMKYGAAISSSQRPVGYPFNSGAEVATIRIWSFRVERERNPGK